MQQASGSAGGLGSTCSSSSINTGGGLHSGIGGGNSHTMASQQPTSGSQNQLHAQQQSTIRHKVCIFFFIFFLFFFFIYHTACTHACMHTQTKVRNTNINAYCALRQSSQVCK